MPTRQKTWIGAFSFIILMVTTVAWTAPVLDTGQTKCYNNTVEIPCPSPGQPFYGQDANYSINPMSYTKLDGNGNTLSDSATSWAMVKDNVTGLIWEKKTDDGTIHDKDNKYTWYDPTDPYPGTPGDGTDTKDFIDALNSAFWGGYSDWRLPTIKELESIVNFGIPAPGPTINTTFFPNTKSAISSSFYWSSTTRNSDTYGAWGVDFYNGDDFWGNKKDYFYVRAVRGGQPQPAYVNNGNGTITDTSTGLMWQQSSPDNSMTWEQSLAYCGNLPLASYTDWRLPTQKELRSLVDYSRYFPAINTTFFPNTQSHFYWSSTTLSHYTISARGVSFDYANDIPSNKSNNYYVRAVRGGQAISTPDIKANGQDGEITVSSGTPVSITASLAPGNENGKLADWWIAASTPWGLYTLTSLGWSLGINMLLQYPLLIVPPVEIFKGTLPAGDYAFYFGVDMNSNGVLDSPLYYDGVQVHVTQ